MWPERGRGNYLRVSQCVSVCLSVSAAPFPPSQAPRGGGREYLRELNNNSISCFSDCAGIQMISDAKLITGSESNFVPVEIP